MCGFYFGMWFWVAEGDHQQRIYSPFASQKQCFYHLKTVFWSLKTMVLPPENAVFVSYKMPDFTNGLIISTLQNRHFGPFFRPNGQLFAQMAKN